MASKKTRIIRYIIGGIIALLGVFIVGTPVALIQGVNDLQSPYEIPLSFSAGLLVGAPLIVSGIALVRRRYRLSLYAALLTGAIYTIIPAAIFGFAALEYYIPAAIVFSTVLIGTAIRSRYLAG